MADPRDVLALRLLRRDLTELLGPGERERLLGRARPAFAPAVDVYYCGDPPKAVVLVELAGVDPSEVALEVRGRELTIAGRRRGPSAKGRRYQQLEIEYGAFARTVALGADVHSEEASASYDEGVLRVELPLAVTPPRRVPIAAREEPDA